MSGSVLPPVESEPIEASSLRRFYDLAYLSSPVSPAQRPVAESISRTWVAASLFRAAGGTFLDCGCGDGRLLAELAGRFSHLIGIDFSEPQLKRASAWISASEEPIGLCKADLDSKGLPIATESVDAAAAIVALEFLVSPAGLLLELHRVMRPGAPLVVSCGNIASLRNRMRLAFGQLPRTSSCGGTANGRVLNPFTLNSLLALLRRTGFEPDLVTCSGRWWQLRRLRPSLLGGDFIVRALRT